MRHAPTPRSASGSGSAACCGARAATVLRNLGYPADACRQAGGTELRGLRERMPAG
jgi:hypothetical protein